MQTWPAGFHTDAVPTRQQSERFQRNPVDVVAVGDGVLQHDGQIMVFDHLAVGGEALFSGGEMRRSQMFTLRHVNIGNGRGPWFQQRPQARAQ